MILANAISTELNILLAISGLVLAIGLFLKKINQPYILAYIVSGVVLGPHGIGIIEDYSVAEALGEFGLIILMFFIGMEISLPDFLKKWRIALAGTGFQIIFSTGLIWILGAFLGWDLKRVILLGFIISLSSTAVVIKFLETEKRGQISQNVLSILLMQDVLIAPMIITISMLGGDSISFGEIAMQLIGGVLITSLIVYVLYKKKITLPFHDQIADDHELQVFGSMIVCFGVALVTSLFGLSAGLGAFVAGMVVHASDSTEWLHSSLHSFRVLLVSVFFISVGMLIDLDFIYHNWLEISLIVLGVYVSNHGINAIALRVLGNRWSHSLVGGSYLAQVGEFSFVLASLGYHSGILAQYTYQLTIIVIAITIFISPIWVTITKKVVHDFRLNLVTRGR
ncbi:MAG: cation:proton antiporter [Cyclobacteriaceae bacterium]